MISGWMVTRSWIGAFSSAGTSSRLSATSLRHVERTDGVPITLLPPGNVLMPGA